MTQPVPLTDRTRRGDYSAFVADYLSLRSRSVSLSEKLVKTLSKSDIETAATKLGVLHGSELLLETEDEIAIVMDYALHDVFREDAGGRTNSVQRFLAQSPPAVDKVEHRLLESLALAKFCLLKVKEVIPNVGVQGDDLIGHQEVLLLDMGFSKTARPGVLIAVRLQAPAMEWRMSTGAALPVPETMEFAILSMIPPLHTSISEERREQADPSSLSAMILKECIAAGASRKIQYASTKENAAINASRAGRRVGRNEPCPCGSGTKYKKCCGR